MKPFHHMNKVHAVEKFVQWQPENGIMYRILVHNGKHVGEVCLSVPVGC